MLSTDYHLPPNPQAPQTHQSAILYWLLSLLGEVNAVAPGVIVGIGAHAQLLRTACSAGTEGRLLLLLISTL